MSQVLRIPEDLIVPLTDYSQWERRPRKPITTARPVITVCSPACAHGHAKDPDRGINHPQASFSPKASPKVSPKRVHKRVLEPLSVKLLKLQVATKRVSVSEYKDYREELSSRNLDLISSILQTEDRTHTQVKELLEKYQKFKGALTTLKQRSTWELEGARDEFETTRDRLHEEIEGLRKKVNQAKAAVQAETQKLQVLMHYKEKEYPVKLVHIEQLKDQIDVLSERNKAEISELEAQIGEERDKCEQQMASVKLRLEAQATKGFIASMQRSVHEKAIQNRVMEKELLIHQQRWEELQESIKVLESTIRQLKKSDVARRQLLLTHHKCLPDTEVHLNIPLQQGMPV